MMADRDWSMLPCDILGEIALKLDQPDDFVYFSAICHSWNRASSLVKPIRNPNAVTPWLLLAENTNDNPHCLRKVYNFSYKKCYRLKVPETFGARCWGSSYGWIAMQTFDYQVHLFNPFTKARITNLPSVLTMTLPYEDDGPSEPEDNLEPHDPLEEQQKCFRELVSRLVVLIIPRNQPLDDASGGGGGGDDLLVAATFIHEESLAFARPGDQSWTYIESSVTDVVCLEDRIYMVSFDGRLRYCDIKGCGDLKDVKVMEYAPSCLSHVYGEDKIYLLDLCGDLVMVYRRKSDRYTGSYFTFDFHAYRLDNKIKKWVETKDIGNFSIFVGHHSSMVVPASVANNCISNCIYYTDDENTQWHKVPDIAGFDMTAFNILSRKFMKAYYFGDDQCSTFCPPTFFLPKCCSMD